MDVVPPPNHPRELGSPVSTVPLTAEGPSPFYPPVCLKTHWDPTAILRRTLPSTYVPQALDPRPWTRVCMEYTTTGPEEAAPSVSPDAVLPTGGQFYPTSRYTGAIDEESQLRRLDRPLNKWCETNQFEPNPTGDMFDARVLVPRNQTVDPRRIAEVSMPKVLLNIGPYDCREANDKQNIALSDRLFNNTTKQDRYKLFGKV